MMQGVNTRLNVFLTLLSLGAPLMAVCPNIVLIIADDCTYLDMEVYGGQAKTPHLNKLAEQGMTFTRCFQAAPMCSPTRHNIYTGLYPVKSGAWPNHTCVYPGTKSIGHYLKDVGYRVALSGKKHISPKTAFPFEYSGKNNPDIVAVEQLFADSKQAEKPFCLIACSNEPHTPYNKGDASAYPEGQLKLPPTFVDTAKTRESYRKYLAEITYFDQQCGEIMAMLDKYNLTDNTLVMILSEQGAGFPFAKWTCFELGLASGMIARWPGKIAPVTRCEALVEYVDILPTFLEASGITIPKGLDGKSFLPVLIGKASEHKAYTYGIHTTRGIIAGTETFGIRSCGTKTHRYIRNLNAELIFKNVVTREGGDKADFWMSWVNKANAGDAHAQAMVRKYQHRPVEELYDVEKDPHCLNNVIADPSLAEMRSELSSKLDAWMTVQGDLGKETEAIAHTRKAGFNKTKQRKKQKK